MTTHLVGPGDAMVVRLYRSRHLDDFGPRRSRDGRYRFVDSSRVRHQLELAARRRVGSLVFEGPVLNADSGMARMLAGAFERHLGDQELAIPCAKWLPKGPFTPQVMKMLRRVERLEIDFQSTDERTRALYRERYSYAQYASTLRQLERHSIEPTLNVTVGLPGEDESSLLETFRSAFSLAPARVRMTRFEVAHGSFFFRNSAKYQVSFEHDPPHCVKSHAAAREVELRWFVQMHRKSISSYNYWRGKARESAMVKTGHF